MSGHLGIITFTLADPTSLAPPSRSNFFQFNTLFGKNLANNRFCPKLRGCLPPEILDLPLLHGMELKLEIKYKSIQFGPNLVLHSIIIQTSEKTLILYCQKRDLQACSFKTDWNHCDIGTFHHPEALQGGHACKKRVKKKMAAKGSI